MPLPTDLPALTRSTRVITAAYDGLSRLIAAREQPGTFFRYAYDLAGNRTGVWVNGAQTAALTYDAADQVDGWQYDAAGNLLSDGSHQWTYDALGRMTSVRIGAGADLASYTYNGDGVLVREQNTWGRSTEYAVDLAAPLSQVLQTRLSGSTRNVLYGQGRLGYQEGGATTWLLTDALGSVRQTADSGGTPGWGVWYDPWGQVEQGSLPTFGFAGEQQDAFTGQVYLRARWYAPGQGRFLSQDSYLGSMDRPDTLHLYAYVGNSPLNRTDRSGHCYGPAAFLRDWEPTNCTNLDMALRIAQHPQASALEREFAKSFIFSFVGSHAALLIGLGVIGWQATVAANVAFTAVSQWGSAYLLAGTSGGILATQVARGGGTGGLPQVGGEAVGALGKAGVCTAATLTFLELLKRVFGQTRADTNTQSRRPERIIVSHYTSEVAAQQALAEGVLRPVNWEGIVFVMEGRSSFKRASQSGARSYEVRIVFEASRSELEPDPEVASRIEEVRKGRMSPSDIISEARQFVRRGPISLTDRKAVIEYPSFWDKP